MSPEGQKYTNSKTVQKQGPLEYSRNSSEGRDQRGTRHWDLRLWLGDCGLGRTALLVVTK